MTEERFHTYVIPENVSDGKIKGFKTRNFIEGIIYGLCGAGIGFLLPFSGTTRISAIIFCAAGPFAIGALGIMGDPVSIWCKNVWRWLKKRSPMLFNTTPRVLEESPMESILEGNALKASMLEAFDNVKNKFAQQGVGVSMVEGEDFEFADDKDEQLVLVEQYGPSIEVDEETETLDFSLIHEDKIQDVVDANLVKEKVIMDGAE